MTPEEVALKLNDLENHTKSLKYRMDEAEADIKDIKELVTSVKLLAQKQDIIFDKLNVVEKKVTSIESAPGEEMAKIKMAIITSIIGVIVGGAIGAILSLF